MVSAEQPQYILKQSKKRALLPKILSLLCLGAIFYLGVLLNLSLLQLTASTETTVNLAVLFFLVIIVIAGIYLSYRRAKQSFLFYANRISFAGQEMFYVNIVNTLPKKGIFDKLLHTYSINLGNNFVIRHIPETIPIQNYLQQLVNYAKSRAV